MSSYSSPSLFIDFSRLPPPKVVEEIAYETLLQAYKDGVLTRNPLLDKALKLEQSATNIILEVEAYGEYLVRERINQAARAVMLAFSTGSDLDHLGALYNLSRDPIVVSPRPYLTNPEDYEDDARFRRRVQLAPESFTTAGSEGAYVFQALSADATIRDVSATRANDRGGIRVCVMSAGTDPTPTSAQLDAVTQRLYAKNIRPLTHVIQVAPVKVSYTAVQAEVTLYPGPDASLVYADIKRALDSVRARVGLIGRDLTRSALITALNQEGVQNVRLLSPAQDIVVGNDGCAWITSATITTPNLRVD